MKLSISNIAWDNLEDKKISKILPNYGFFAIEIAPTKVWKNLEKLQKNDIIDYKNFWKKQGIRIIGFQSLLYGKDDFNIFNLNIMNDILYYLNKVFWVGNILEIKTAVFGSPKNRFKGNLSIFEAEKRAIDFFYKFGEIGKKYNIKIALEPNPREYGADFLMNTQETLDFIKKINHPFIQLNLDTGILILNKENLEQSIKSSISYLTHFHISEPYLNIIDEDKFNIHIKIAKILKKIKYKNYCSIEMKSKRKNNLEHIKKTISFISKIYG
ncbi:MAG: hypothetical protein Fur009_6750 [Candidatus Microgenomates bacterium]